MKKGIKLILLFIILLLSYLGARFPIDNKEYRFNDFVINIEVKENLFVFKDLEYRKMIKINSNDYSATVEFKSEELDFNINLIEDYEGQYYWLIFDRYRGISKSLSEGGFDKFSCLDCSDYKGRLGGDTILVLTYNSDGISAVNLDGNK